MGGDTPKVNAQKAGLDPDQITNIYPPCDTLIKVVNNVNNVVDKLQVGFAVVCAACTWYFGGLDGLIVALIAFMVIDYLTGVINAALSHEISSAIGFKGLFKKMLILLIVGMAHLLDTNVIGGGSLLREVVISFYISNEAISVLENAIKLGIPVPGKLKAAISEIKKKGESTDDSENRISKD